MLILISYKNVNEIFTGIFRKIFVLVGIKDKLNTWQKTSRSWNRKSKNSAEGWRLSNKQKNPTYVKDPSIDFYDEMLEIPYGEPIKVSELTIATRNALRPSKQLRSSLMHFSPRQNLKTVLFLAKKTCEMWRGSPRPPLDQIRSRFWKELFLKFFLLVPGKNSEHLKSGNSWF